VLGDAGLPTCKVPIAGKRCERSVYTTPFDAAI